MTAGPRGKVAGAYQALVGAWFFTTTSLHRWYASPWIRHQPTENSPPPAQPELRRSFLDSSSKQTEMRNGPSGSGQVGDLWQPFRMPRWKSTTSPGGGDHHQVKGGVISV